MADMKRGKEIDGNMELRSEKVREILGEIPSSLMRWGLLIIAVICIAIILVVCLVPYPYSDGESILRHLMQ